MAVTVVLAAEKFTLAPLVGDVVVGSEAEGVLHSEPRGATMARLFQPAGRCRWWGTGADLSAHAHAYEILSSIPALREVTAAISAYGRPKHRRLGQAAAYYHGGDRWPRVPSLKRRTKNEIKTRCA